MDLKQLRKNCNLTQKEAAEIVGMPLRTYVLYENDEVQVDQLKLERVKEKLKEHADQNTDVLSGKVLLITGGTGSFGNAVLNRFLTTDVGEIRIFSRDEKKQDDMRHEYQAKYPDYAQKIKFYIGDVRSLESCRSVMKGVDYIFHAAALKQVPSCEFFPMEAVKTNVIGTDNILTAAIEEGVKCVICLSTDKAAYPINAMGITKAIEEKVAVAKSRNSGSTRICCTRYGNVMCSRGSVIPLWIDQIKQGLPITLTEPSMTRFIMSLEEAVDLVLFAFKHGQNGDILVQKAPACTIGMQAEAVCEMFGGKKENIKVIGIRHGEKMYETLLTKEECAKAEDLGNFYRVPADNRNLNYDKYFSDGNKKAVEIEEFNSNNTYRLNKEEIIATMSKLSYIQQRLAEDKK
ncbi:MAG: polysaccharide biosynthesis protein [Bacilli bacterium]|nr:polysaccharide biosynthesis protein [Bacilli bacterium]